MIYILYFYDFYLLCNIFFNRYIKTSVILCYCSSNDEDSRSDTPHDRESDNDDRKGNENYAERPVDKKYGHHGIHIKRYENFK